MGQQDQLRWRDVGRLAAPRGVLVPHLDLAHLIQTGGGQVQLCGWGVCVLRGGEGRRCVREREPAAGPAATTANHSFSIPACLS